MIAYTLFFLQGVGYMLLIIVGLNRRYHKAMLRALAKSVGIEIYFDKGYPGEYWMPQLDTGLLRAEKHELQRYRIAMSFDSAIRSKYSHELNFRPPISDNEYEYIKTDEFLYKASKEVMKFLRNNPEYIIKHKMDMHPASYFYADEEIWMFEFYITNPNDL